MNAMVKILLKKGIVTDLARICHGLDLNSPHLAATINTALKPLETLSRIINQPQTIATSQRGRFADYNLPMPQMPARLRSNIGGIKRFWVVQKVCIC